MTRLTWGITAVVAASIAVLVLLPNSIEVVPAFSVVTVDSAGRPVAGACVHLSSQNYTLESTGHWDEILTDSLGHAAFKSRSLRASRFDVFIGTLRGVAGGVHSSYGNHNWVLVWAPGLELAYPYDPVAKDAPQKLVLTPDSTPHRKCGADH